MDIYSLTDRAILGEIGRKLKEVRLKQNIAQKELAESCGLSTFSISQMEHGHNTSLLSLIMVLRALNRLDVLEDLLQEEPISPVALSAFAKKHSVRKRSGSSKHQKGEEDLSATENFDWDDR